MGSTAQQQLIPEWEQGKEHQGCSSWDMGHVTLPSLLPQGSLQHSTISKENNHLSVFFGGYLANLNSYCELPSSKVSRELLTRDEHHTEVSRSHTHQQITQIGASLICGSQSLVSDVFQCPFCKQCLQEAVTHKV